jgi:hypothetical protein
MTVQPGANLYTQGFGSYPENVEIPVISNVNPAPTNVNYPIGKRWINQSNNTTWELTSITASQGTLTASWISTGGSTTAVATISGNTGTATPVAGNIAIDGTANEITTTASGNTITLSLTNPLFVGALQTSSINNQGAYAGNVTQVISLAAYTVTPTDYILACDTVAQLLTLTLPLTPLAGDMYVVADIGGAVATNPIRVNGNGHPINIPNGTPTVIYDINVPYTSFFFIFTSIGWTVLG